MVNEQRVAAFVALALLVLTMPIAVAAGALMPLLPLGTSFVAPPDSGVRFLENATPLSPGSCKVGQSVSLPVAACIGDPRNAGALSGGVGSGADGDLAVPSGSVLEWGQARAALSDNARQGETLVPLGDTGSFSVGDEVLIHQTLGSGAGQYEIAYVSSVGPRFLALNRPLTNEYSAHDGSAAQVIRVPHYRDVTVAEGATLRPTPWDGKTGGILAFRASGTVTVDRGGIITASASSTVTGGFTTLVAISAQTVVVRGAIRAGIEGRAAGSVQVASLKLDVAGMIIGYSAAGEEQRLGTDPAAPVARIGSAGWYTITPVLTGPVDGVPLRAGTTISFHWSTTGRDAEGGTSDLWSDRVASFRVEARNSETQSAGAHLVYFDRPGTVYAHLAALPEATEGGTYRGVQLHAEPAGTLELIRHFAELAFVSWFVMAFLLKGLTTALLFMLSAVLLRRFKHRCVKLLPRSERREAANEIEGLIAIAKYASICVFALVTMLDVFELVKSL